MKLLLSIALVLISATSVACEVIPDKVLIQLETEKPESIVSALLDGKDCEAKLFDGISSGKPQWLKLAAAFQLGALMDAGAHESLEASVGEAMLKAPSRVLPLIRDYTFDESVCLPAMYDDSGKSDKRYRKQVKMARTMFEAYLKTSLRPEAVKCLDDVSRVEQSELFDLKHHQ